MRIRRIAVLIDGGFFLKRLPKVVEPKFRDNPDAVADTARILCKRHVQRLIGEPRSAQESRWLDHVYRLFYYDASPYEGVSHHPVLNRRISFGTTDQAAFRRELFNALRRKRKFALRLGKVVKEGDWQISSRLTKQLVKTGEWLSILDDYLHARDVPPPPLSEDRSREFEKLIAAWRSLDAGNVALGLRQKGVDMRIGLDIASLALKRQADTIILVTGDSDFVPAAKFARREGVEFILDPMRQSISDDLFEHIDGLVSPLQRDTPADRDASDDS